MCGSSGAVQRGCLFPAEDCDARADGLMRALESVGWICQRSAQGRTRGAWLFWREREDAARRDLMLLRRACPFVAVAAFGAGCPVALALAEALPVDALALVSPRFPPGMLSVRARANLFSVVAPVLCVDAGRLVPDGVSSARTTATEAADAKDIAAWLRAQSVF